MEWLKDVKRMTHTSIIGYLKKEFFKTKYPLKVEIEITLERKTGKQLSIDLKEVENPLCLAIAGNIYERKALIQTGQIRDVLEKATKLNEWKKLFIDKEKLVKLLVIWKRWHLNDLVPGTRKQMEVIRKWRKKNNISEWAYEKECEVLKEKGLLTDKGYKYGTAWLYEPLPKEVIEFVKRF